MGPKYPFPAKISRVLRGLRGVAIAVLVGLVGALLTGAPADAGTRLDRIRDKGYLTCGIWPGVGGFAQADGGGGYHGLDVDVCRAVAVALFAAPDKVKFVMAANVRQLVDSDDIDIVARRITWSLTRATANGLMFGPVTFYDGQGFMVPRKHGLTSAKQLADKAICVQSTDAHGATLTTYFQSKLMRFKAVAVETNEQAEAALISGACAAFSADISLLGGARAAMAGGPDAYDILPELISKEPLAPLVRQGDDQFFEIVRWSFFAMVAAEERGITSENIDDAGRRGAAETQRLLGLIHGNGAALGLDERWAYNVIKSLGNYGEMFERNLGRGSPIKLERGLNKLWTDGGLMYAPRLR